MDIFLNIMNGETEDSAMVEEMKKETKMKYNMQQYKEALNGYNKLIELCPSNAIFYANRAACNMMLGHYDNAFKDARKSVDLNPECAKTYQRLIKCAIVLGDTITASYALQRLLEIDPDTTKIQKEKDDLDTLQTNTRLAESAIQNGEYRMAIFLLRVCIDISHCCTKFKLTSAECLMLLERYQEAMDIVLNLLRLNKQDVEALYIRGMCLYYQDNIDRALSYLQQVLRLAPDHTKAIRLLKTAKQLKATKASGDTAFKTDNFQTAYNHYTKALEIDPKNTAINMKLYFNRASAAAKLGKIEESIEDCTKALKIDENYLKAIMRRAESYMLLKDYEKALADFKRALKLHHNKEYERKVHEASMLLLKSKRKNYYNILGVKVNASIDDIRKAYKKKALEHHPDRHANAKDMDKRKEELMFKDVLEAYTILSDPCKRQRYDRDANNPDAHYNFHDVFSGSAAGPFSGYRPAYGRSGPRAYHFFD